MKQFLISISVLPFLVLACGLNGPGVDANSELATIDLPLTSLDPRTDSALSTINYEFGQTGLVSKKLNEVSNIKLQPGNYKFELELKDTKGTIFARTIPGNAACEPITKTLVSGSPNRIDIAACEVDANNQPTGQLGASTSGVDASISIQVVGQGLSFTTPDALADRLDAQGVASIAVNSVISVAQMTGLRDVSASGPSAEIQLFGRGPGKFDFIQIRCNLLDNENSDSYHASGNKRFSYTGKLLKPIDDSSGRTYFVWLQPCKMTALN